MVQFTGTIGSRPVLSGMELVTLEPELWVGAGREASICSGALPTANAGTGWRGGSPGTSINVPVLKL